MADPQQLDRLQEDGVTIIEDRKVSLFNSGNGRVEVLVDDDLKNLGTIRFGRGINRFKTFEEVKAAVHACTSHFQLEQLVVYNTFKNEFDNKSGTFVAFINFELPGNKTELADTFKVELSSLTGLKTFIVSVEINKEYYWPFMDWLVVDDRTVAEVKQYFIEHGWLES